MTAFLSFVSNVDSQTSVSKKWFWFFLSFCSVKIGLGLLELPAVFFAALMGAVRLLIHCKTKADQKLEQSECLCAAAELSANNLWTITAESPFLFSSIHCSKSFDLTIYFLYLPCVGCCVSDDSENRELLPLSPRASSLDPLGQLLPQAGDPGSEKKSKRTAADYRALWRTAIHQQILLLRMEKENQRLEGESN